MESLQRSNFDFIILDWMLPDGTADGVLNWIRDHLGWNVPVICVTVCDSEADVVNVLRLGADDYFVKSPRHFELLARIESLARRNRERAPAVLRFGPYKIHQDEHEITFSDKKTCLTQKEFELACYLFHNPNRLLSRVHLLEKIWGIQAEIDTRTVYTNISRIRHKLDTSPQNGWEIVTVYGYGYRLQRTVKGAPAG
jgi:two-component system response regulator RegX3